jgi:hypothetical protein
MVERVFKKGRFVYMIGAKQDLFFGSFMPVLFRYTAKMSE